MTKTGDNHYDTISAFIKSMRGSDPDAAVYYLARMLYAGEDVTFIARRIMICAAEDVGNADPQALVVAVNASHGGGADRNAGGTDHSVPGRLLMWPVRRRAMQLCNAIYQCDAGGGSDRKSADSGPSAGCTL